MTNRKEEAQKTKQKLILSAKKIVSEKGIDKTCVEDITKDACVAKGTFYSYFKNKEDILKELVCNNSTNYSNEFLSKKIDEKIKIFNTNLQKRIASSGIEVCRSWIANNLRDNENSILKYDLKSISSILESSIENGELDNTLDVKEFANFIVNVNYGEMINWCMTDEKFKPLDKIDDYTKIIMNALKNYLKENK